MMMRRRRRVIAGYYRRTILVYSSDDHVYLLIDCCGDYNLVFLGNYCNPHRKTRKGRNPSHANGMGYRWLLLARIHRPFAKNRREQEAKTAELKQRLVENNIYAG